MIGVNLAGAEFATNAVYPTTAEIDYFASKGMGVIRLPFKWERLQPTQNGPLDQAELAQIKAVVDYAGSKGINVVLDVHNFGSGYGNVIGSAATPDTAFADLWGKLATTFRDSSQVLFGLMNEPNSQSSSQWVLSANAAIAAIRDAGAEQRILVPGAYHTGAHDWISSDNDTVVGAGVVDPLNNYSFEVHQYLDANNSGTSRTVASEDVGVRRLAAVTQWAIDTGHTLFLGEFGVSNDPTAVVALDRMLQFMEQNAAVWVGATYWAAGPSWGDYMYSVEPDNLANPVDKVQLDVLEKYDLDPSTPVPDISPPPPLPDGIAMTRAIDAPSVINEGEAMQLTFSVRNAVAGQTFDFWQQSAIDAEDFEHSLAADFAAALPAGATYTEITPLRGTITLAPGTYSFTLSRQTRIDGVVELIDKASWAEGNQENTDIRIGSFTGGLKLVSESAITNWVTDRPYADPSPPSPMPGSVSGTAAADVLNGTAAADSLYGLAGNDTLNGLGGNDRLVGGGGNDRLDGGAGADEMWGEAGNDTYSVDDPGDQVYEGFGGGTDTVQSTISYHLGDNVENLLLRTGAGIDGTGNALRNRIEGNSGNNRLVGNAGDDTLLGGGGNDILIGGIGQDVLTGGAGSDLFVFDVPHDTAADQVTDFAPGIDRVGIDSLAFGLGIGFGMAGGGSLDPDWFAAGGSATAGHGQFVFDAPSATLFWDADGLGPDRPTALAVFKPGVVLNSPISPCWVRASRAT
ncbi:cellulase family glycosylhydrolase [Sphingomonas aerophila]|uniref:Ca2+-binding RTX toxin-like protein n=1 Tax=Sphingomonas aerophila TaxID=1344948 RepID=A0A7W9EW58_9SPHN|nr:cellulase family glycosylhydrolase [Sphingomonas aerophila]MBB5715193.1 Ca2+-binding RTX toxin-like protein [Sphingomonas aerophila]